MNTKSILLSIGLIVLILAAVGAVVYNINKPQTIKSRAQVSTGGESSSNSSCQVPAGVTNVRVDYPNCQ